LIRSRQFERLRDSHQGKGGSIVYLKLEEKDAFLGMLLTCGLQIRDPGRQLLILSFTHMQMGGSIVHLQRKVHNSKQPLNHARTLEASKRYL